MTDSPADASPRGTHVILVEVDPDARTSHRVTLETRGYVVTAADAWPPVTELNLAGVLVSDLESFETLPHSQIRRFLPLVVLAGDARAGVTACLNGADAWVPTNGDEAYLVDTIDGLTNVHVWSRASRHRATEVLA